MSPLSITEISHHLTARLEQIMPGQYSAILLTGAAARGETTCAPDGSLLSDLDYLVILRARQTLTGFVQEKRWKPTISKVADDLAHQAGQPVSIGLANQSARYWRMAAPFMLELHRNAQVAEGSRQAKDLPLIRESAQIPIWEGIRLVANRMCELYGEIWKTAAWKSENPYSLHYACLKLALACSEAVLIQQGEYRCTYRERQTAFFTGAGHVPEMLIDLITLAYQAKLGENIDFFSLDADQTITELLQGSLLVLQQCGIRGLADRHRMAASAGPSSLGLVADMQYFAARLLQGKIVPIRRAIMGVYAGAEQLVSKIAGRSIFDLSQAELQMLETLYCEYLQTPQVVSVLTKAPQ